MRRTSQANSQVQQFMKQWEERYRNAQKAHEQALEEAKRQYEDAVTQAQSELQELIAANEEAQPDVEQGNNPATRPTPNAAPAAVWIDAPDGDQLMVLNKEAVIMILAIFDRLGKVLPELQEVAKAGARKR